MSGLNLLVFREDRRRTSGKELKAALTAQIEQLCSHGLQRNLLGALLLAGELECGVADSAPAVRSCELLTDQIADPLLAGESALPFNSDFQKPAAQSLLEAVRALPALEQLSVSTPEGFAYY